MLSALAGGGEDTFPHDFIMTPEINNFFFSGKDSDYILHVQKGVLEEEKLKESPVPRCKYTQHT